MEQQHHRSDASQHHAYCLLSFWIKHACDPTQLSLGFRSVCMHDCHCTVKPTSPLVHKCHITQIPNYPYLPLYPPMLDYTSITYTYYIQCQSDQHYYVHLTPVKLLPSEVFPRPDQKGLDTRNRTRRMILPIPTNVRLFITSLNHD